LTRRSHLWEHRGCEGLRRGGGREVRRETRPVPKAAATVLEIARAAEWPDFPAVKQTFAAADYAPSTGTLIFDVGGNKYRLVTRVDFEEEVIYIESVMTHEEYDREDP
jgi:mRNA interferase HigB